MTSSSSGPLRIGILGAARIARLFVEAVRPSTKVVVTAVASRDGDRAAAFARELDIGRVHSSYDALFADPDIDAVYVPLPNNLHAEWSIRAAAAGKHVLCEKPLAANAAQARSMFDAARKNGVYLVEAYPYRAQPQTLKVRELVTAGAIGRIQLIQASFGFPLTDVANIRMDPTLAGGALMDAGSYPVSFVRMVAGTAPVRVSALSCWGATGVDLTTMATLEYPDGLLAQISCSFTTARHRHAFISGDAGSISTPYFNDTGAAFPPLVDVRRGSGWDAEREVIETGSTAGFLAEAESFHDLVRFGWEKWTGATPDESIDIALTLDAIAASSRRGVPVEVGR
ncbi:1,5-anhydro-D-fructose reductase [Variovorax sp. PBL-H6]|uniref:Gfo/Idh/MocA family protein n=1 Tax=Variovorax sp. PBL-H6 TaxID=434009 RepID=UPI00131941CD|nr:Gfo/Idh/MocA family oxidoreductase [Variovorax sp. PBL-H6]VTU21371.1 1,5-anhydro-D-fructose reductase [Variovorax sp. PBL-H6]